MYWITEAWNLIFNTAVAHEHSYRFCMKPSLTTLAFLKITNGKRWASCSMGTGFSSTKIKRLGHAADQSPHLMSRLRMNQCKALLPCASSCHDLPLPWEKICRCTFCNSYDLPWILLVLDIHFIAVKHHWLEVEIWVVGLWIFWRIKQFTW